jgi:hypothetical protein
MYQYSQTPNPPGQGQYTPANSITYGPDGTITSENLWVADGSAAGGHFESRTFQGYGKEPDKPSAPAGEEPKPVYFMGKEKADSIAAREAWAAAKKKYEEVDLPEWEKTHADWQSNKDKYDKQQSVLSDLEGKSLEVMNQGVDEIVKRQSIQDQKENLIKQQNEQLDPQIAEQRQIEAETTMARGQTGSRAAVDRGATMDKAVLDTKRTINENASAYAYALANQEFGNAMNVYGAVRSTRDADTALALQKQGLSQQTALQQNSQGIARYATDHNTAWNNYLAKTNKHQNLTQGVSSTINGLAFLYGFKGGGGGGGSTTTPTTTTGYGNTPQIPSYGF